MNRFVKAAMSLNRIVELGRCAKYVNEFTTVIPAFIGVRKLDYPAVLHHRSGYALTVYDFEDLTTLWAVWCADEYHIPSDAKVIVDAGANIGAFSLFALAKAPQARVIALEPFPSTFEKLTKAIGSNSLAGAVSCEQVALTDTSKTVVMDASPDIKSHSRKIVAGDGQSEVVEVPGWGLSEVIASHDLGEICYLKIDIEGGEVPFFAGVETDVLRKAKKIGVECHSRAGQDVVWSKLETAGFKLDRVSRGARFSQASTAEFIRV